MVNKIIAVNCNGYDQGENVLQHRKPLLECEVRVPVSNVWCGKRRSQSSDCTVYEGKGYNQNSVWPQSTAQYWGCTLEHPDCKVQAPGSRLNATPFLMQENVGTMPLCQCPGLNKAALALRSGEGA
jgi:hypothetical protein